ncbi:hypothetical protein BN1723_020278, partial [Verticillium longisporum]
PRAVVLWCDGVHRDADAPNHRGDEQGGPRHLVHLHERFAVPEPRAHGPAGDHMRHARVDPSLRQRGRGARRCHARRQGRQCRRGGPHRGPLEHHGPHEQTRSFGEAGQEQEREDS